MTTATTLRKEPLQAATDAVVRITTSTICGVDLDILEGDVPSVTPGRILGHEGVGVVQRRWAQRSRAFAQATE